MKVLFLDIDGVVNKRENFNPANGRVAFPIDRYCAFLVGRIQIATGCDVVLSSSWRHHPDAVAEVENNVVKILDMTPTLSSMRGDEINLWFSSIKHGAKYDVEKYAILDDDSDFYDDQPLFKTTFIDGLTDEIAERVIEHLGRI